MLKRACDRMQADFDRDADSWDDMVECVTTIYQSVKTIGKKTWWCVDRMYCPWKRQIEKAKKKARTSPVASSASDPLIG